MKKFKIGLVVIIVFAILAVVTLVLVKKYRVEPKKTEQCETGEATTCKIDLKDAATIEATKTTVGSFGDKEKIKNNIYSNEKLKFKISFPQNWSSALVKETIPSGNSEGMIEFQLPTSDTVYNGYISALVITFYKKASYNPTNSLEMKLAENTEYVVSYRAWEQPPSDSPITEKEIATIASSFEFMNK